VGSKIIDETGAEVTIQRTAVGGVMSEGMFCDSRMLGWIGGAENIAAQMPASLAIGDAPPATKPRGGNCTADGVEPLPSMVPAVGVKPLFEKKMTKEEKKKLAEEKRKAKKAAKEGKTGTDDERA
jgi:hypothetical protein